MRNLLAKAVIAAGLLLPLCLFAQPRGAPRSFGRSGGSFRSFSSSSRAPVMPRQARSIAHIPSRRGFGFPRGGRFNHRGAFWGFEPVYPGYSGWFPPMDYDTDQSDQPAPDAGEDPQLAAQVDNLTQAVESMREDQRWRDFRGAPRAAAPRATEEKPPSTLLVYRDGRQTEIQNYAILGQTLWVFSGQTTRQVPLAEIDLPATERVNGNRGVDFTAPASQ